MNANPLVNVAGSLVSSLLRGRLFVLFCMLFAGVASAASYNLTMQVNDAAKGSVTPAPGVSSRAEATSITLTATPTGGNSFVKWEESLDGATYVALSDTTPFSYTMPASNVFVRGVFNTSRTWVFSSTAVSGSDGTTEPPAGFSYTWGEGAEIVLTATPNTANDLFSAWNINGVAYSANPYTFVVPASDGTIEAVFAPKRTMTLSQVGNGTVTVRQSSDLIIVSTGKAFLSTYTVPEGAAITLTGVADSGWRCAGFTSGGNTYPSPYEFAVEGNQTIDVEFRSQVTLVVEQDGVGAISGVVGGDPVFDAPGTFTLDTSASVVVTATPPPGYEFLKWTRDSYTTIDNPYTFLALGSSTTLKAWFRALPRTLHMGTPTGGAPGLTVPAANSDTATEVGGTVQIRALPDYGAGFVFSRWVFSDREVYWPSDTPYDVVIPLAADDNSTTPPTVNVHGVFILNSEAKHLLAYVSSGHGTLSIPEDTWHEPGHAITITATPESGYLVKSWRRDTSVPLDSLPDQTDLPTAYPGDRNTYDVTMDSDLGLYVYFAPEHTVSFATTGSGSGALFMDAGFTTPVPAELPVADGDFLTLYARADAGSSVESWSVGGVTSGYATTKTISSITADITVSVQFSPSHTLVLGKNPVGSSGTVTVNPVGLGDSPGNNGTGSHTYVAGTTVTVTADPPAISKSIDRFAKWTSDAPALNDSQTNPLVFNMDGDITLSGNFGTLYNVTINAESGGLVKVNGGTATASYSGEFPADTVLNLEAVPDSGNIFNRWSGASGFGNTTNATTTFTVIGDAAIVAQFLTDVRTLTLSVQPEGGGTILGATSGDVFTPGSVVSLTAGATLGYRFREWLPADAVASPYSSVTDVTMDANKSITAVFVKRWPLTMSVTPLGAGTVSPGSSQHDDGSVVNIGAQPAQGWRFDRWTGDAVAEATSSATTVTISGETSLTANFIRQYTLSATALPSSEAGSVSVSPHQTLYDENAQVTLTATAATGWGFKVWRIQDVEVSAENPFTTAVTQNTVVEAVFEAGHSLTILKRGNGTTTPAVGVHTYPASPLQNVTLDAVADSGWRFLRWENASGGTESETASFLVVMDGSKSFTAVFEEIFAFASSVTPDGGGSIAVDPVSPDGYYVAGTILSLEATPTEASNTHYRFDGWTVDGTAQPGTDTTLSVTMDAARNVQARFVRQVVATINAEGGSVISTPASLTGRYDLGSSVSFRAQVDPGYRFAGWRINGADRGTTNPLTLSLSADTEIMPLFYERVTLEVRAALPESGAGTTQPPVGNATFDIGARVPILATPQEGWRFDHWTGDFLYDDVEDAYYVQMDAAGKWIQPVFARVFSIDLTVGAGGTVVADPQKDYYEQGEEVTLTASPSDSCHAFGAWTVDGASGGAGATLTLTMDQNHVVAASFTAAKFALTLLKDGDANAIITGASNGEYDCGASFTLRATTISPGSVFQGWTVNGVDKPAGSLAVTMAGDTTITARFTQLPSYTLLLHVSPPEAATLIPVANVEHSYYSGTQVQVRSTIASGWRLVRWEGDVPSAQVYSANLSLAMTAPRDVTLVCAPVTAPITILSPMPDSTLYTRPNHIVQILCAARLNIPDQMYFRYVFRGNLLGQTSFYPPYESPGLMSFTPAQIGTSQTVLAEAVEMGSGPAAYTAEAALTVADALMLDLDGNILPDDPFGIMVPGDLASYSVSAPGLPVQFAAQAFGGPNTDNMMNPVRVSLFFDTFAPERRLTAEVSPALLEAGEWGILLVMASDIPENLYGPEFTGLIPDLPLNAILLDGGTYCETSLLVTSDNGATFSEVDPARLAEHPVKVTLNGLSEQIVKGSEYFLRLESHVEKTEQNVTQLSLPEDAAWVSMTAGLAADSIYASHSLYASLDRLGVIVPIYMGEDALPVADFSATPLSGFAPLTVQFTDLSMPGSAPITSRAWDFGDGATSTEVNPTHVYTTPGSFTVSLTVSSASGGDARSRTDYIQAQTQGPSASFSADPEAGYAPLTVNFTDLSLPGTYPITAWAWNFGDGAASSDQNPAHVFTEVGPYTVTLTVTTEAGTDDFSFEIIVMDNNPLEGTPPEGAPLEGTPPEGAAEGQAEGEPVPPDAQFSASPLQGVAPLSVTFTDRSTPAAGITEWAWIFGDGTTSTEKNPVHVYTAPGVYSISLTVKSGGLSDTANRPGYVRVSAPPVEGAPVEGSLPEGELPIEVTLGIADRIGLSDSEVIVPVSVDNASLMNSNRIEARVQYDPARLDPDGMIVEATAITGRMSVALDYSGTGEITITATGPVGTLRGRGHLFDIRSTLTGNTGECGAISVADAAANNAAGGPLSVGLADPADLCVYDAATRPCLLGDMNADGRITKADATEAFGLAVGSSARSCTLAAGDFNGDGAFDAADIIMIRRKLVDQPINPTRPEGKGVDPMLLSEILENRPEIAVTLPANTRIAPGESMTISIEASDLSGIAGANFALEIPAGLTVESVSSVSASLPIGYNVAGNVLQICVAGEVGVTPGTEGVAIPGALARLQVRLADSVALGSTLTMGFTAADLKGQYGDSAAWYATVTTSAGTIVAGVVPSEGQAPVEGQVIPEGDSSADGESGEGDTEIPIPAISGCSGCSVQ